MTISACEGATYRLRIIGEEADLFQLNESLANKVSVAIDKERDFDDRPGRVPDVFDLQQRICLQYRSSSLQSEELASSWRVSK